MSEERLIFLAIEKTCDETGAAVLEGPRPPRTGVPTIRSSVVASQFDLHERFQGVVPEIASRAHVRQVLPAVQVDSDDVHAGARQLQRGRLAESARSAEDQGPGLFAYL